MEKLKKFVIITLFILGGFGLLSSGIFYGLAVYKKMAYSNMLLWGALLGAVQIFFAFGLRSSKVTVFLWLTLLLSAYRLFVMGTRVTHDIAYLSTQGQVFWMYLTPLFVFGVLYLALLVSCIVLLKKRTA